MNLDLAGFGWITLDLPIGPRPGARDAGAPNQKFQEMNHDEPGFGWICLDRPNCRCALGLEPGFPPPFPKCAAEHAIWLDEPGFGRITLDLSGLIPISPGSRSRFCAHLASPCSKPTAMGSARHAFTHSPCHPPSPVPFVPSCLCVRSMSAVTRKTGERTRSRDHRTTRNEPR